jgi:hypothetical protein
VPHTIGYSVTQVKGIYNLGQEFLFSVGIFSGTLELGKTRDWGIILKLI